jgi:hypothetical protein
MREEDHPGYNHFRTFRYTSQKCNPQTIVDPFTNWVEAFPHSTATGGSLIKVVLEQSVPRFSLMKNFYYRLGVPYFLAPSFFRKGGMTEGNLKQTNKSFLDSTPPYSSTSN